MTQPSRAPMFETLKQVPGSRRSWFVIGAVGVAVVLVLALFLLGTPAPGPSASSRTYTVTFTETGLAAGRNWSVILNGSWQESFGSSINFTEPNGLYSYALENIQGYSESSGSGVVRVSGSDVSVPIVFTPFQPLGTAFSWATPINATGTEVAGCPSPSGHYCYVLEIAGAGQGVTTSDILLALANSTGAIVGWPGGIVVSLLLPTNASAVATFDPITSQWTLFPPYTGSLSGGDSMVFYSTGTGPSNSLRGLSVVASGQNGFTGRVVSAAFT